MARKKPLLRSPAFLIPTGLLLILIAAFVLFILYNQSEVEKRLAAIRAAGYPVTCEELDQWYPDVPPEENAANLILQAIDAFVNWNDKPVPANQCETYHLESYDPNELQWTLSLADSMPSSQIPEFNMSQQLPPPPPADWNIKNNKLLPLIGEAELPDLPEHLSDESLAVINDYLADNTRALQLLHQAATLNRSRYPIDLSQGVPMLPHLKDVRTAAKILNLEAIICTHENKIDQSVQSIIASIRIGASLKEEPILVSAFIKISCEALACYSVEYILNHITLNIQQLQTLQTTLNNIDNKTVLARAIAGERSRSHNFFTNPNTTGSNIPSITISAMKISGLLEIQQITYLDYLEELIQAAQLDYPHNYQKAFELDEQIDDLPFYHFMIRLIVPALSHGFEFQTRSYARNLITRTALAIERFRLKNNRLPETLDELIPDFLAEIPRDPFDSNNLSLRYRLNEIGYTLYSIGEDQADNNGAKYDANGSEHEPGTDLPFTIHR